MSDFEYVVRCPDGTPYTWAANAIEAQEERAAADGLRDPPERCECGGRHEVDGPASPRVGGPRGLSGDRRCRRCKRVGHNVRTCTADPPRPARV